TTNWTADPVLTPGPNLLQAYAVDTSSNTSALRSVSFVYVVSEPVSVQIDGLGQVTPNYDGQLLELGQTYTMTAKPARGFAFTGWSGSVSNAKPKLTFVMASNLAFTATFKDIA